MEQTIWTSRKFNFDFPITQWPVIIGRLQGTLPRIQYLVRDVPQEILTTRFNDTWSVQQQIGHLIDLEELHTARIHDFKDRAPILSAWDTTNKKTDEAAHNEKDIAVLLDELQHVRNEFMHALMQFSDEEIAITSMHPRLQVPMRVVDMAYFVAEHDDHHIAKMIGIIGDKNQIGIKPLAR